MRVRVLTWWQVLDNWRLDVLGDEGSGAPSRLAAGSPVTGRPVEKQCRDFVEAIDGFDGVRAELRHWALSGSEIGARGLDWCSRSLVPKVGTGLVVLPPRPPEEAPKEDRGDKEGSLRDRGRSR